MLTELVGERICEAAAWCDEPRPRWTQGWVSARQEQEREGSSGDFRGTDGSLSAGA
jgi:hypothetical protein